MPQLLDLPVELRLLIIEYALGCWADPPAKPSKATAKKYSDVEPHPDLEITTGVFYTQDAPSFPTSNLLLVNHQISDETRAVLKIASTDYVLDISLYNEIESFVTWQSVSHLTNHVSTLYTNIRLFGPILDDPIRRPNAWGGRCGQLSFHVSFYRILMRFLSLGAVGEKLYGEEANKDGFDMEGEGKNVFIDTLVMDFQSAERELSFPPEDIHYGLWNFHNRGLNIGEIATTMPTYKTRPEWPCMYLIEHIEQTLTRLSVSSRYGKCLYENIGNIKMLVDGQLKFEFDLSARLAGLVDQIGMEPLEEFRGWKEKTLLRREAHGCPTEANHSMVRLSKRDLFANLKFANKFAGWKPWNTSAWEVPS